MTMPGTDTSRSHVSASRHSSASTGRGVSRRYFLQAGLATTAGLTLLPRPSRAAVNEKLNLAFIGVGGRGGRNLKEMTSHPDVNVVALCDVNRRNLDKAAGQHPKAATFVDFRKLYDELTDFDGVVVSTTEHTHAYATLPALQLRKHVYCEKPLTHNVHEARRITQEAAQAKVATQMGTQIHGMPNYRRVVELIQSGAIGPVREAHVWVDRAWGLQSAAEAKANGDIVFVTERPKKAMTPPDYLDWDLWIGPAPFRPYHEAYFPGPKWYRWWDFGNGTMSDLGSHWNDLPYWALQLTAPTAVEAFGDAPHPEIAPASMSAVYEYPQRGELPECRLTWYQGSHKPELWKSGAIPQWKSAVLFVGEKAMVLSSYSKHEILALPGEKSADVVRPEPFIEDSPGQHREWLLACQNGTPTGSPFSYSGPLTEANHLGNVAFRAGERLEWDAVAMRAKNCPLADEFLGRKPRSGWSLG